MFQAEIVKENAAFLVEGGFVSPGSTDSRRQQMQLPPCASDNTSLSDRASQHWHNWVPLDPGGLPKTMDKDKPPHPRNPGETAVFTKKTKPASGEINQEPALCLTILSV